VSVSPATGDNYVMAAAWEAERLVAEVRGLAVRGLPRDEYYLELAARLRRRIAIDATCWHGVDPRTLLLTTASPEELLQRGFISTETLPPAAHAFWACEYEREDYNTFAALARRRAPVGILSEATRGRPQRSLGTGHSSHLSARHSRCAPPLSHAGASGVASSSTGPK
jgi:hypothetical protein